MATNANTKPKPPKKRKARSASVKPKRTPGAVGDDEVLTVQELADRICSTPNQIYRDAKNLGLPIRKRGGRSRIIGKDYNDWWRGAPVLEATDETGLGESEEEDLRDE